MENFTLNWGRESCLTYLHDLFQASALSWIQNQEFPQQVLAISGDVEGDAIFASQNTLTELAQSCSVKRKWTTNEGVKNYAERPNVNLRTVVLSSLEKLRCRVGRGSCSDSGELVIRALLSTWSFPYHKMYPTLNPAWIRYWNRNLLFFCGERKSDLEKVATEMEIFAYMFISESKRRFSAFKSLQLKTKSMNLRFTTSE